MFKVLQQKRAHAVSAGTACLVSSAFPCWAATTCCASQALTDSAAVLTITADSLCSIGMKTSLELFYDD